MQIKDPTKKLRKWRRKITKKGIELGPAVTIDNWFFKGPGTCSAGCGEPSLGTIPNAMLYFVAYECEPASLVGIDTQTPCSLLCGL